MEAYQGHRANAQPSGSQARPGASYKQPSGHPQSPQRYLTLPLPEQCHPQRSDKMLGSHRRYPPYPMQGHPVPQQYARQQGHSVSAEAGSGYTASGYHQLQQDPMMARKPRDQNARVHFETERLTPTPDGYMQPRFDQTGGGEHRRSSRQHRHSAPQSTLGPQLRPPLEERIKQPQPITEEIVNTNTTTQDRNSPLPVQVQAHPIHTHIPNTPPHRPHRQRPPQSTIAPTPNDTLAPLPPSKDRTKYGKQPRVPEVELISETREVGRSDARVAREKRERRSVMPLNEMEEDLSCPICMSIMVAAHAVSPCGHTLCGGCAYEWIRENQTCAICRKPLTEGNGLIPIHSLDALVERYVDAKGETWDGLEEFKEKKEIWEAQRTVIREEEAARTPAAPAASDAARSTPGAMPDIWGFEELIRGLTLHPESPPPGFFHRTFADDFFVPPTTRHIHAGRQIPDSAFAEMLSFIDTLHDHERFNPHLQHFHHPPRPRETSTSFTLNFGRHAGDDSFPTWAHRRNDMEDGIAARVLSALRERL